MHTTRSPRFLPGSAVLPPGIWISAAWMTALLMTPWNQLGSHHYLQLGYHHTILSLIGPIWWRALLWTLPLLPVTALLQTLLFRRSKAVARPWLKGLLLTIVLSGVLASTAVWLEQHLGKKDPGPNVILIVIDTLRQDFTSLHPAGLGHTPEIQRQLQPDAVYYPRAYSTAPWTLPSIASILTARYPSSLGVSDLLSRLSDSHLTLAEILKEEGYTTHGIVSHLLLTPKYGLHQGFDILDDSIVTDRSFGDTTISSPRVTDKGIAFIRGHQRDKFFLMLHYFDPHFVYLEHEQACPYQGPFTSRDINTLRNLIRQNNYQAEDLHYLTCSYGSEVAFTDAHLGRFLSELKSLGLYDNTIIVLVSDHGEEFAERRQLGHSTTLYSELTHIPLLIKPTIAPAARLRPQPLASTLDILPTVLTMLDIKTPDNLQGQSLTQPVPPDRVVFAEVNHRNFGRLISQNAAISGHWKLIHNLVEKTYELYDLVTDAAEQNNQFEQRPPAYAGLKMNLVRWEEQQRQAAHGPVNRKKILSPEEERKLKSLGYL